MRKNVYTSLYIVKTEDVKKFVFLARSLNTRYVSSHPGYVKTTDGGMTFVTAFRIMIMKKDFNTFTKTLVNSGIWYWPIYL